MGMFRTIRVELPCDRCGRQRPAVVQFKTGCDAMEEYVNGQIVPADDDIAIVTTWPASVDRYCDACGRLHQCDRRNDVRVSIDAARTINAFLIHQ